MKINHLPLLNGDELPARLAELTGGIADAVAELFNRHDDDAERPAIRWHSGDLHLPAFFPDEHDSHDYDYLIVDGDMIVEGCLAVSPQREDGGIVVLGRLQADTLICWGGLVVRDDVRIRHAYCSSGNDGAFVVGGDLTALTLVETGSLSMSMAISMRSVSLRCRTSFRLTETRAAIAASTALRPKI
ncbi:hypothetical protein A4U88_3693 [Serratia marcescens]|nr:hypothetical protein A4U88_3693 [Serratia marcescens]